MSVDSQPRLRRWPLAVRVLTVGVTTTGLVLLAAACGGSPGSHVVQIGTTTPSSASPATAAPAQQNGAVGFSTCMRSNGVPTFPDPDRSGAIPKVGLSQLGVSSSRFQAAQSACNHLLPNGGRPPSQAQRQSVKTLALAFSQCVRAHGVPNFPDPDSSGRIPDPATVGIDQGSPKFEAANQACGKYRPPYMPSNSAYNAYARTHGG